MRHEERIGAGVFALRLPKSTRFTAVEFAKTEGLSLNQFIALAVAEKIVRMELVEQQSHEDSALMKKIETQLNSNAMPLSLQLAHESET